MALINDTIDAIYEHTELVRNSFEDPIDQINAMKDIFNNFNTAPSSDTLAELTASATAAIVRLSAIVGMGYALINYKPSTSNEALTMLNSVTSLINLELIASADRGDNSVYQYLRNLRYALVAHITKTAIDLPALYTRDMGSSLPSLAAAYQLYGDASRSNELVERTDAPCSLWLPQVFETKNK